MKKILLGTTAVIALGTMTTEAFAADKIKLGLGGFMRHYVGVMNHDQIVNPAANSASAKAVKLLQFSNTEIYVNGDTTLDNGIKVGVVMQLEADGTDTAGRNMDEVYAYLSSDAMGKVEVGTTDHAGAKMMVGAPNAGKFGFGDVGGAGGYLRNQVASSTTFGTAATNANNFAWSSYSDVTEMGERDAKLNYYTPTFSGFTGYASYTAAENFQNVDTLSRVGSTRTATRDAAHDASTFGVNYKGDLSGVALNSDLTYLRKNGVLNQLHFGLSGSMAGFTVGGGYGDFNDETTTNNDGKSWELGVAYATGPYSVSARYMDAESKGTVATAGDNKDKVWMLAATYDLGAGVALSTTYWNGKADPEGNGTTTATGLSTKNSGVVAGLEIGF